MTTKKAKGTPCSRCGQPRLPGRKTTTLCVDCKYVMSRTEVETWEKKKAA